MIRFGYTLTKLTSAVFILRFISIIVALSFMLSICLAASAPPAEEKATDDEAAEKKDTDNTVKVLNLPDLTGWEPEIFEGVTRYETYFDEDGLAVLKADSEKSASGLVRKIEVDLKKTPYLNWSWKIDKVLDDINETTKSGDDYPARIYVVISGGIFFWNTKAVNYVWASDMAKGANWPNAFTGSARMIAVESGEHLAGKWIQEKRNVLKDFKTLFDIDAEQIDAVAIMTDTDNSKQSATAYYGDIYFTVD